MIAEVLPPDGPMPCPPQLREVEQEVPQVIARAEAMVIETEQDHDAACEEIKLWSEREKQAHAVVDPIVESSRRTWKSALALQSRLCGPYEQGIKLAKAKVGAWRDRRKRLAAEQSLLANRAAQTAAEDEALARAAWLEKQGRSAEAAAALIVQPPIAVVSTPKVAAQGVSTREAWSAEVEDFAALFRWVAADPAGRLGFLAPNLPPLNAQARSQKAALNIPGVRPVMRHA